MQFSRDDAKTRLWLVREDRAGARRIAAAGGAAGAPSGIFEMDEIEQGALRGIRTLGAEAPDAPQRVERTGREKPGAGKLIEVGKLIELGGHALETHC